MANKRYQVTSFGTIRTFMNVGSCSGALMTVLDQAFDRPLPDEERAAMPLAGGIAQQGYQCGMLWGAVLAAGAEAYRRFGAGSLAETAAAVTAKRLVEAFRDQNRAVDCLDVSGTDWNEKHALLKSFLKGGPIVCMRKTGTFSKTAYEVIDETLSTHASRSPAPSTGPVSCAAELARKAGLSDMHVIMAAGLAAGMGFSGGGCGALGTAIWINEMRRGSADEDFHAVNERANRLIEAFLKHSDYEMECHSIANRRFTDADEHAAYLTAGGCAEILDSLARQIKDNRSEAVRHAI